MTWEEGTLGALAVGLVILGATCPRHETQGLAKECNDGAPGATIYGSGDNTELQAICMEIDYEYSCAFTMRDS